MPILCHATEKRGVTYRMKEIFLKTFRQSGAEIAEYCLPKDGPGFCTGCTSCIQKREENCKDAESVGRIESSLREADLIVMCSPAYVMHTTGAMKTLLDHLACRMMQGALHRADPEYTDGKYWAEQGWLDRKRPWRG